MKNTTYKRWMLAGRGMLAALLTVCCCFISQMAWADIDCTYSSDGGEMVFEHECPFCGTMMQNSYDRSDCSYDEAYDWSQMHFREAFCEDCGGCLYDFDACCCMIHHCQLCEACIDEPSCWACLDEYPDGSYCESCRSSYYFKTHCYFCDQHFEAETGEKCDCGQSWQHCKDCVEMVCKECGICLMIDGESLEALNGGCDDHELCNQCIFEDDEHCTDCGSCAGEICDDCGYCRDCIESNDLHCPECDYCFGGGEIEWCLTGGAHCIHCCEENCWLCDECGTCVESEGQELCDECGLCEGCCKANTEDSGCTHGYCIESGEYAEHVCPSCEKCPDDTECPDCMLCEECQQDYHCEEHGICPESSDWDEHLCSDCGDCFEPDELCEYCGKCEDCASDYHCEHGYCPDDGSFEDDFDHFICQECGDCYEGLDRCDYCELCTDCCNANTSAMGCDHDFCVESEDFAEHWCYTDDQCLELCNHNASCAHNNIMAGWESDNNAHWKVCEDCGAAVNKAIHTDGNVVTTTEPNASLHMNGSGKVYCAVCEQFMGIVSIPFTPIPEDGSPYIIDQPKDYEGKVCTSAWEDVPERYTTIKVKAGGKNLIYQWYEKKGNGSFSPLVEDVERYVGTKTSTLKAIVYTDACNYNYQYYCVVSNNKGSVTSKTIKINAQHVFKRYEDNGNGTHSLCCMGECGEVKWTKPHRYEEWTLVRPATDTQTGLYEQKCMDCSAKKQTTIPKVEAGHVHNFNFARSSATTHWFVCKCGVPSPNPPQAHSFGTPVVLTPATETRIGQQQSTCSVCNFVKTETIAKLPHTHDYWGWVTDASGNPDPEKCGRNKDCHYYFCKSGDKAMKKEAHDLATFTWGITREATSSTRGLLYRYCETCGYSERKYYDYGTYPILVVGGTASHDAAAPGTRVTITYTKTPGIKWGSNTYWMDQSTNPRYSGWNAKPVTLSPNIYSTTVTFTMPNGPVLLEPLGTAVCYHTGGTVMGERENPTCRAYGHEPDKLCADCGEVVVPGARIEALGHDLPSTPIAGTAQIVYCTNMIPGVGQVTDASARGYSGDFICKRCGLTVGGKKTPVSHGRYHVYTQTLRDTNGHWENEREETCTTDGYSGDWICDYCGKIGEKGAKVERLGHEWGEWTVVRAASTRVKGLEQRICQRDPSHKETRVTDYTGPDYRLKASKTKLVFKYTYGAAGIDPQTVTFTSVGRNEITGIYQIDDWEIGCSDIKVNGMKVTITPKKDKVLEWMMDGETEIIGINYVNTREGRMDYNQFTAPTITYTVQLVKADPQLRIEKTQMYGRPGRVFASPRVWSQKMLLNEDYGTIKWTSSNGSVATVDPNTGKVTPLTGGQTIITATTSGNRFYKSASVSYTLDVIGEQEFTGSLWQIYEERTHEQVIGGSNKVVSDPVEHTLKIAPSTQGTGKVDVTYGAFQLASTGDNLRSFSVKDIEVYDYDDGKVLYDLSNPKTILIFVGRTGKITPTVTMEGGQHKPTSFPIMILNLITSGKENTIVFGPQGATLNEILQQYATGLDEINANQNDNGDIYDLQGRKLDKITQPGIYIKNGKKILQK